MPKKKSQLFRHEIITYLITRHSILTLATGQLFNGPNYTVQEDLFSIDELSHGSGSTSRGSDSIRPSKCRISIGRGH